MFQILHGEHSWNAGKAIQSKAMSAKIIIAFKTMQECCHRILFGSVKLMAALTSLVSPTEMQDVKKNHLVQDFSVIVHDECET